MKALIVLGLVTLVFSAGVGRAEEKNGLRVTAQKTVLERERENRAFSSMNPVEKSLGLKVTAKNISFKAMPEGSLSYIIIVKRWGQSPSVVQRYTGTDKLPALKPGEEIKLSVGKVKMAGYETLSNHREYQDSVEGWQVVVTQAGAETIKITSTSSFESLNRKATEGPK